MTVHTTLTARHLELGERFVSPAGPSLTVSRISYPPGTEVADIQMGTAVATEAIATEDGRGVLSAWHRGPVAGEVYYERYGPEGRTAHGWVDRASRLITQTG